METEETIPERKYRRALLAIAELIKAKKKLGEEKLQQSASQQQVTDELSATDL
jgi:hypothetical protein